MHIDHYIKQLATVIGDGVRYFDISHETQDIDESICCLQANWKLQQLVRHIAFFFESAGSAGGGGMPRARVPMLSPSRRMLPTVAPPLG